MKKKNYVKKNQNKIVGKPNPISNPSPVAKPKNSWLSYRLIGKTIGSVITIFVTYIAISSYLMPKVTIEAPTLIDSINPYHASFKVQNQGTFEIEDLHYLIFIKGFYLRDSYQGYIEVVGDKNQWLEYIIPSRGKVNLEPLESDTPKCSLFTEPFPEMIKNGQLMGLRINYRLWFWPVTLEKDYLFKLKNQGKNMIEWIPIAHNSILPKSK